MLMQAGFALMIGLGALAIVAIVGFALQAAFDKAADIAESRHLMGEKLARRARYERLAGLNR